jgi:A nuclease family of the HNH/ENDO VII superfamily with conserved AHH
VRQAKVFALVCGMLVVLVAIAASTVGAAGDPVPADLQIAPLTLTASQGSGGPPPGTLEQAQIEAARLEAESATPEAEAERQRSQHAFEDLDPVAAGELAQQQYPSLFEADAWRPLEQTVLSGKPADDFSAPVTLPGGQRAVAVSSAPSSVVDDTGRRVPVDLSLQRTADGLAPEQSAVDTVFPARSSDPVQLGDIGLDLGGDAAVRELGDGAWYADPRGDDVDWLVKPTPTGVETFAQVRSADAPHQLRLTLRLPAGATLRQDGGDGSVAIVRDGAVLADVAPPSAVDAQQQPVAVTQRVEGTDLVLDVDDHDGQHAFPLLVDPAITYAWNSGRADASGWRTWQSTPSTHWCGSFFSWYQGLGFYAANRSGDPNCAPTVFSYGEVLEFNYYAEWDRGSTAWITGWDETYNFDPGFGGMCHYSGVYSPVSGVGWQTFTGNACGAVSGTNYHRYASSGSCCSPNYAVFGTQSISAGQHTYFTNALLGATVYLTDPDAPTTSVTPPAGWVSSATFPATAHDSGLGVMNLAVSGPSAVLAHTPTGCSADPANHCPADRPLSVPTTALANGINTVTASAQDVVGRVAVSTAVVKVDRTAPASAPTLGGTMANGSASGYGNDRLTLAYSDRATGAGADVSGIHHLTVGLDGGGTLTTLNSGCATGATCPATWTGTYSLPAGTAPGAHYVTYKATDSAGNASAVGRLDFLVNPADVDGPDVAAIGGLPDGQSLNDHDGGAVGPFNYTLQTTADDGEGSGVAAIHYEISSGGAQQFMANCSAGCPVTLARDGTISGASLPEGLVTFTVGAVDKAGNEGTEDAITVLVDKTSPAVPQDVVISDVPSATTATVDWTPGQDPDISATQPGAGTTGTEYRYRKTTTTTWTTWVRTRDSDFTLPGVTAGDHVLVDLRTVDHAANVSTVVETELVIPATSSSSSLAAVGPGFDICTPRIDYARTRANDPDYQNFRERTYTHGAQLKVWCNTNNTSSIKLTGHFSVQAGLPDNHGYKPLYPDLDLGEKAPKQLDDVIFRGVNYDCVASDPDLDGTNDYVVAGTIKFIRPQAVDVTLDYNTDFNNPAHLHCPTVAERQRQVLAGWHWLAVRSVSGAAKGPASVRLRATLGPQPYTPHGVKYAWDAHHVIPWNEENAADLQVALFRCGVHPNSTANGLYLRGRSLRKTLADGTTANPNYQDLQAHSSTLAAYTWHYDTTGLSNVNYYLGQMRAIINPAQYRDRCSIGNSLAADLATVKDKLKTSTLGAVAKPNH